jgi:hypothetical protein
MKQKPNKVVAYALIATGVAVVGYYIYVALKPPFTLTTEQQKQADFGRLSKGGSHTTDSNCVGRGCVEDAYYLAYGRCRTRHPDSEYCKE